MSSRTSRPSRSASAWARGAWVFCACVLFCLFSPARLPALTPSEQEQIRSLLEESRQLQLTSQQLRQRSSEQTQKQAELGQRLEKMRLDGQTLDAKLQLWQEYSAELSDSLESLSSELATSRSSLASVKRDLDALSKGYSAYKLAAEKRILVLDGSARTWRIVAVAGIFGALAGGFLAGLLVR